MKLQNSLCYVLAISGLLAAGSAALFPWNSKSETQHASGPYAAFNTIIAIAYDNKNIHPEFLERLVALVSQMHASHHHDLELWATDRIESQNYKNERDSLQSRLDSVENDVRACHENTKALEEDNRVYQMENKEKLKDLEKLVEIERERAGVLDKYDRSKKKTA